MTTAVSTRPPAPASIYRQRVERMAAQMLMELLGSEAGQRASARVALAFAAAARTAKRPEALYQCDPASVASCVAYTAMSGLQPGGVNAECWLIPRGRELTWMISHRGLIKLARQGGYTIRAIPVHRDDPVFRIDMGDVEEHESNPDVWPSSLDELRGVYVTIVERGSGETIGRPWMPIAAIQERVKKSQTGPVWKTWPVEMAMKTAIKWACARGYVPLGIEASRAMEADTAAEVGTVAQVQPSDDVDQTADLLGLPAPELADSDLLSETAHEAALVEGVEE